MLYRKIKASLKEAPERFYRTLLVRADVSLEVLGIILGTALGASFEHMFMFIAGRTMYVDRSWLGGFGDQRDMAKTHLEELPDKFIYEYDTGDSWRFDCRLYKKIESRDSDDLAFLIDGRGQGIWEDNKDTLMRYLDGELDPELDYEDEDEAIYFPWNYENDKLGDFDTRFDLKFEQEDFEELVKMNVDRLVRPKKTAYGQSSPSDDVRFSSSDDYDDYDDDDDDYDEDDDDDYDDDDLDDYDDYDDYDEDDYHWEVIDFFDALCAYQIEHDDYVHEEFVELAETIGQDEASEVMLGILIDEMHDLVMTNEISSLPSYRRKIAEIKEEVRKIIHKS